MTPVDQQHLPDPARGDGHDPDGIAGDCLRASLATILDLPADQVPHVAHYPAGHDPDNDPLTDEHGGLWWRRLRRWLRDELNLDVASYEAHDARGRLLEVHQADGHPWSGDVVVVGPSPRGPFAHAVAGRYRWVPTLKPGRVRPHLEVTHDPHPSRAGLIAIEYVELIVPLYDPPPPDL